MKKNVLIKQFDIARFRNDSQTALVIGRRDTGKSWLLQDLGVQSNVNHPGVVIASGLKDDVHELYKNVVPEEHIHADVFSPEIIKSFVERHRDELAKNHTARTVMILDNCFYCPTQYKCLEEISTIGKSCNITQLVSMSYPIGFDPESRSNLTYVFILRESSTANRRRIYEAHASFFDTFDEFCSVLDGCTASDYDCMVIDNSVASDKIEDRVFWYNAHSHV